MSDARKPWLLPALMALLALGTAATAYYFRDYFHPREAVRLPLQPGCDLRQQACERVLPGGGRLRFAIEPRGIPLVQPLTLKVDIQGLEVDGVEVDFSGVSMNMGYNRPRLESEDGRHFQGQGMLPVCIRQRMDWEAQVMLDSERGLLLVPFRFETVK